MDIIIFIMKKHVNCTDRNLKKSIKITKQWEKGEKYTHSTIFLNVPQKHDYSVCNELSQ